MRATVVLRRSHPFAEGGVGKECVEVEWVGVVLGERGGGRGREHGVGMGQVWTRGSVGQQTQRLSPLRRYCVLDFNLTTVIPPFTRTPTQPLSVSWGGAGRGMKIRGSRGWGNCMNSP